MLSVTKCLVACAVAAFFTTAAAEQGAQGACKQDVEKLCKDVQPGEGRVLACLEEHQSEVSHKCAGNLKQVKQALKQVSAACEPDIEKFCWNTPIGKGGIAKCLKQHSSELTPDCKDAVAKAKAGAAKAK
jgi:cysteine rich repeat protein